MDAISIVDPADMIMVLVGAEKPGAVSVAAA